MRLLQIIVVLFGISFITFGLTYMSPGDPVRNMYSANGVMPTEEMVEQTREEMGLNDPFFVQYGRWLGNCLQGDFGKSYSLNKPVTELLAERLWPTLKLTLMAILLMLVLSIPLGMASGWVSGTGDHVYRLCDAELLGGTSFNDGVLCLFPDFSGNQFCGRL